MKKHLVIYGILIALFIAYNLFFRSPDPRLDTVISILGTSIIFGYIAFMALVLLRKMRSKK